MFQMILLLLLLLLCTFACLPAGCCIKGNKAGAVGPNVELLQGLQPFLVLHAGVCFTAAACETGLIWCTAFGNKGST